MLGEAPPPSPRVFATWTAAPTQVPHFAFLHGMHGLCKSTVLSIICWSAEGLRYSAIWWRCGPAPAAVVSCASSWASSALG